MCVCVCVFHVKTVVGACVRAEEDDGCDYMRFLDCFRMAVVAIIRLPSSTSLQPLFR